MLVLVSALLLKRIMAAVSGYSYQPTYLQKFTKSPDLLKTSVYDLSLPRVSKVIWVRPVHSKSSAQRCHRLPFVEVFV